MFRMPPKILFVSYTAAWTGPTNSLWHLLRYLRPRFDVGVLVEGQGSFAHKLQVEGIPCFSLPSLAKTSILAMLQLIRRERFDLVYGNNTGGCCRNAFIAAKLTGVPFVCHIRGLDIGWWKLWFLRAVDAAVAVSAATAGAHRSYLGSTPTFVIPNGVALDDPEPDRISTRRHLLQLTGFPPEAVVIIGVADLNRRKGQLQAIDAFHQVAKLHPDARLLLVGALDLEPDYVARTRQRVHDLGLAGRVQITGFRADVGRLLKGSDVFLHTAMADPHPRAVLEAMKAALACVAFSVDGVSETVVESETGLLVEPGDLVGLAQALGSLLDNTELRTELGRGGRRRVGTMFSAVVTARQVGDVVEGVLQRVHDVQKQTTRLSETRSLP